MRVDRVATVQLFRSRVFSADRPPAPFRLIHRLLNRSSGIINNISASSWCRSTIGDTRKGRYLERNIVEKTHNSIYQSRHPLKDSVHKQHNTIRPISNSSSGTWPLHSKRLLLYCATTTLSRICYNVLTSDVLVNKHHIST